MHDLYEHHMGTFHMNEPCKLFNGNLSLELLQKGQDRKITLASNQEKLVLRMNDLFPFLKKRNVPTPASFEFIFVFSNTLQIIQQITYVKKCPSSIWCQDSNSRPLEHDSPPITTRPGLPPLRLVFFL